MYELGGVECDLDQRHTDWNGQIKWFAMPEMSCTVSRAWRRRTWELDFIEEWFEIGMSDTPSQRQE